MTREELHTEVASLTSEIIGMVSDLSPFDWKRKSEIDREILALFDRFEEEKWTPCATPPVGGRDVVVWDSGPNYPRIMYYYKNEWHDTGVPVVLSHDAVWRELPAPPQP